MLMATMIQDNKLTRRLQVDDIIKLVSKRSLIRIYRWHITFHVIRQANDTWRSNKGIRLWECTDASHFSERCSLKILTSINQLAVAQGFNTFRDQSVNTTHLDYSFVFPALMAASTIKKSFRARMIAPTLLSAQSFKWAAQHHAIIR